MKNSPIGRTDKNGFEIDTCSRCGGSGHYSYNQITGTRCFKCSGAKDCYTKRGATAKDYYRTLRQKSPAELKVGDVIWEQGFSFGGHSIPSRWATVLSIKTPAETEAAGNCGYGIHRDADGKEVRTYYWQVETKHTNHNLHDTSLTVTKSATPEEAKEKLAKALAYQLTLGKSGKVLVPRQLKAVHPSPVLD